MLLGVGSHRRAGAGHGIGRTRKPPTDASATVTLEGCGVVQDYGEAVRCFAVASSAMSTRGTTWAYRMKTVRRGPGSRRSRPPVGRRAGRRRCAEGIGRSPMTLGNWDVTRSDGGSDIGTLRQPSARHRRGSGVCWRPRGSDVCEPVSTGLIDDGLPGGWWRCDAGTGGCAAAA